MSKDTLSQSLRVGYDEISQQYVVTTDDSSTYMGRDERLAPRPIINKRSGFFNGKINNQNFQPRFGFDYPSRPPMSPRPPRPPVDSNPAVRVSRQIYNDLDMLVKAYRFLRQLDNRNARTLENLESQARIMRSTMGNIFRTLSGRPLPPLRGRQLELDENYCASLKKVADFTNEISQRVLVLMRLVNISNIDRQLLIINVTLNSQNQILTNLYNDCRLRRQEGEQ